MDQTRTRIRRATSGGQNEPYNVIAGMVVALLICPNQLKMVLFGKINRLAAFEEYAR
ncbi:MAG: hypothetical protein GDA53_03555 [Rhodobacteraceae bacterium]|nr:hypothetical protein [Paracoccaceae bacterium]